MSENALPPNTVEVCNKISEKDEEKGGEFEDILNAVGSSGRWQVFLFCLTCLTGYFNASQHLGQIYLGMTPDHWCLLPELSETATSNNWTADRLKQAALPIQDGKMSTCNIYERNYTSLMQQPWSLNGSKDLGNSTESSACHDWQYDTSEISSSFVTEWNLVCDRRVLLSTVQAMYMAGVLFGAVFYGYLSDRFGRRKTILIGMAQFCTASILTSFSTYYGVLLFLRFVTGSGAAASFGVSFVLVTECCGINVRDFVGCAYEVTFPIGYMVLAGLAYAIRDWSNLQLAVAVPSVVLLCYFWFLPESPRWLVQKGDFKSALPIIKNIAKVNGANNISDTELLDLMKACHKRSVRKESREKITRKASFRIVLDLFRTKQMLKQILICYAMWISASMGYYGLAFNSPAIASDPYFVTVINGIMEVVAYVVCYFIIRYLGRKISICSMFLVGGISCLLVLAVPIFPEYNWAIMMLTLIGKFCITIVYAILYLYTMEIFPTNNRNVALGTSSMFARIGSMSSPYILDVVAYHYGQSIPNVIFGLTAVTSGILSMFLPESKGKCMPDTPEDVEKGLRPGNTHTTKNGTFTLI